VSELVVVIAVCGLSFVLTALHARSSSPAGASTPHDLERMLAAVQRACADFLWQETKLSAALLGIVIAVVAIPIAVFGSAAAGRSALGWGVAALCLGSLAGTGVAHFSHRSSARTALVSLGALRRDRNIATLVTLRGASLLSVGIDAASSLLAALTFTAHFAYLTRVVHLPPHVAAVLASRSLAALAFGALCAAVVFQVGGTSLHTAAGVAATSARARHPQIARDEDQNPVLVAELVGDFVGGIVARSTDTFAGLALANAGVVMLAALVAAGNVGAESNGVLALVALPLVIRSLGQFAASVALGSSRFENHLGLSGILVAARLSHALLLAAGVLGACLWALGQPSYAVFALAGALGVLGGALSASASALTANGRRSRYGALSRPGPSVAQAFGLGLQRTWASFLLVGGCLAGAWWLGSKTPLLHGGVFALTLAVAAMLGAGAFNACESTFGIVCDTVQRLASLRRGQFDDAARGRAKEMDHAGVAIGHLGHTQTILSGAAAALLGAVMLPLLRDAGSMGISGSGASVPVVSSSAVSLAHPIVLLGGVLGAAGLLFHVGGMLRASSRAAASLDKDLADRLAKEADVERQGPLPGYRSAVQLAIAGATQTLLPLALGAVLGPFFVAVALRVFYGAGSGDVSVYGLMAFSALAALTGCCAALVAQGTCLELSEARKAGAEGSSNTHSAIEFMERCIGPAALLGLKATVVSSLATVPLLF